MTAELLGADSDDHIELINTTILESYLWDWHRVPYTMMRQGMIQLHTPVEDPRIDEWILSNEKWLRTVDSPRWQHGLVTLNNADIVFPKSSLTDTGRTITRPKVLPGFQVLCDSRASEILIQPSTEAFKKSFEYMTDGLLKNLDWANVFVAGGMALGTLVSVRRPGCDLDYVGEQYDLSDIDIYIYGLSAADATTKIRTIYKTFRSNVGPGTPTLAVKSSKTITFYARHPLRRIQIILKLVESPKDVLLNFDIDICAMGWDGCDVWMLPRAARALETGSNVFTMNLIHGHYLSERRASHPQRIFKYGSKGYGIRFLPSYVASLKYSGEIRPETPSGENNTTLDMEQLAEDARIRTEEKYEEMDPIHRNSRLSFFGLDDGQPRKSCLTGFTLFMCHVSHWEITRRNNATLDDLAPAYISYEDTYEDNPSGFGYWGYRWDGAFRRGAFIDHIRRSNRTEIERWSRTDTTQRLQHHGVEHDDELDDAQRITCDSKMEVLLESSHDIKIPVLLPCEFAAYANEVVKQMSGGAYLPILKPAVLGVARPAQSDQEGLFIWSISSDLMWQQEDRRIDELFEVLLAFRRVNMPIQADEDLQTPKLLAELARREIRASDADEFKSFSRWIAQGA
ncbi:hypothetical protein B0H11DRAFT_2240393 [Mycena galericulata]|nr:hypothetical protein B0H11DRAFT_2240393 [Mycena galericulata]